MLSQGASIALLCVCLLSLNVSVHGYQSDNVTVAVLKDIYNDLGGTQWFSSENWLNSSAHYCTWFGLCCSFDGLQIVYPNGSKIPTYIKMNTAPCQRAPDPDKGWGPLRAIFLTGNGLAGSVPSSVGMLSSLNVLDFLYNPNLKGTLPLSVGPCAMPELGALRMSDVFLPNEFLSSCDPTTPCKLEVLEIFYDVITFEGSPIPPSIGNCSNLSIIMIIANAFDDTIAGSVFELPPSIGNLSQLRVFSVSATGWLVGTLPSEIGLLTNLQDMEITSSNLVGSLPTEMGNMQSLMYCVLQGTNISGTLPSELARLSKLEDFGIPGSHIHGPIPTEYGLLTQLTTINFQYTELNGTIPCEFGQLKELFYLNLGNTNIHGSLPSELGECSSMNAFVVSHTNVNGTLPSELGNWFRRSAADEMHLFQVHSTGLSGSIPSSFSNWEGIEVLSFANTSVFLPPLEVGMKPYLSLSVGQLLMSNSGISGDVCEILAQLAGSKISIVDLSDNPKLGGQIDLACISFLSLALPSSTSGLILRNTSISGKLSFANLNARMENLLFLDISHCPALEPPYPTMLSYEAAQDTVRMFTVNVTGISTGLTFAPGSATFNPNDVIFGENFRCQSPDFAPVFYVGLTPSNWGYENCECLSGFTGKPPHCQRNSIDVGLVASLAAVTTALLTVGSVASIRWARLYLRKKRDISEAMKLLNEFRQYRRAVQRKCGIEEMSCSSIEMAPFATDVGDQNSSGNQEFFSKSVAASDARGTLSDWVIPYEDILIIDSIGQGSFGTVSLGLWNHAFVAVKKFNDMAGTVDTNSFTVEALLHIRLRHPNIVQLLGVCLEPLCTVSEFMKCGSLYEFLRLRTAEATSDSKSGSRGGDSLSTALLVQYGGSAHDVKRNNIRIATDIAQGMAYLHAREVIHRDLKSLNILLSENGTAKVCDFGACKSVHGALDVQKTMTMNIGTAAWMAPEVMGRDGYYTAKCDVYSFGIILWELGSGRTPYEDLTFHGEIMDTVESGGRPPVSAVDMPEWYIDLMCRCWSASPDERPTFEEVLSVLQSYANDF